MFINQPRTWYSKDGDLLSCTALYLVLFSDADNNISAAVRQATLKPFGPWMAGQVRLAGAPVTVSGAYGETACQGTSSPSQRRRGRFSPPSLPIWR